MNNKRNVIKEIIIQLIIPLFVAGIVILISELLAAKQHYGSPAIREAMEVFLIFILPILPIIYGIITRNKIGAILIGVLPFLGISIMILFMEIIEISSIGRLYNVITFWFTLTVIAGFEGYFASQRKILIACGLLILLICVFLFFGIH